MTMSNMFFLKTKLTEEEKRTIIQELNTKIGGDINELSGLYGTENKLVAKRDHLEGLLTIANNEVPKKLKAALKKAEKNSNQANDLKTESENFKKKLEDFKQRTNPLRTELNKRFTAIERLEEALVYVKSFERVEAICRQLKQCTDDEQSVLLYEELKDMCNIYQKGHRAVYVKEYTHYWHHILKDKLSKEYEDVLKQIKWPFSTGVEYSPPAYEIMQKFINLTRFLFLICEPEDLMSSTVSEDLMQEQEPCLPVRLLLRPIKKRFTFHFTGTRQTARIDRPEWFLTQTLTWIKDHQGFVKTNVQPVADQLQLKGVKAVDEFNAGLIALAAERLHSVLAMYNAQGAKGDAVDVDAAFAHAVDETLGFHKELTAVIGKEMHGVLSVLTRAETFVKWLAVEKKYALAKMDSALCSDSWSAGVCSGAGAAAGAALWVPRAADWLLALLTTVEQRYTMLPQPGHRLQFLELQLELVEEWRVRLTQLMGAALADGKDEAALTAIANAAHHVRAVLLQWSHSLHYLQLHYYRQQFQHFTQRQHETPAEHTTAEKSSKDETEDESFTLKEVEVSAKKMALNEVSRNNSIVPDAAFDTTALVPLSPIPPVYHGVVIEEAGVFGEAPPLLSRLRDAALAAIADQILTEFKAAMRDYKRHKWHALPQIEDAALCASAALCRPAATLSQRLAAAARALQPSLAIALRARVAEDVDRYVFEEVVLANWFNTGGTMQFTHDVKRTLAPLFAPPTKRAAHANLLPKLLEACKLLNMDYEDGRRLRSRLAQHLMENPGEHVPNLNYHYIRPSLILQILSQRTDLCDATNLSSVMELF